MESRETTERLLRRTAHKEDPRGRRSLGTSSSQQLGVGDVCIWALLGLLIVSCELAADDSKSTVPKKRQTRIHSLTPDMVLIEGGEFLFGSPISDKTSLEYHGFEKPQEKVRVEDFYLARFLVTVEDYCEFLNEVGDDRYVGIYPGNPFGNIEAAPDLQANGRYRPRGKVTRSPAHDMTWKGAMAYTTWLANKTGLPLRLPTQTEWEYAVRGHELREWPWGNGKPKIKRTMRTLMFKTEPVPFYDGYGDKWMFHPYDESRPRNLAAVGSFPKNATPDGVYDMVGYFGSQWCADACRTQAGQTGRITRGDYHYSTNDVPDEHLFKEPSQWHEGRTWNRYCASERNGRGMLRLAMDAAGAP